MSEPARTVVARVVFPLDAHEDVLPLYVDGDASGGRVEGRGALAVLADRRISLGSYFNAFPAAYWQAETAVREVRLTLVASGGGTVVVMRSDAEAVAHEVHRLRIPSQSRLEVDLPLSGFERGGAYWIDLIAGPAGMRLEEATWSVVGSSTTSATVAMATFNRPADCHTHLRALAAEPRLREVIDRIVVVDQGEHHVTDEPGFDRTVEALGDRLVLLRQPNLGGSGGFSRGMLESLERHESDYVLLLDDDAVSEPEAISRAVRFAAFAAEPLIVGGGMLHLDRRAVLYTQSEQWDARVGWVRLNRDGAYDHDFAAVGFRQARYFHRRQHADFNGWWMCLIPVRLLREAGLALPLFLKGDDVEFGLRARSHGVRTVSVPGIALWHMGWGGKAPTRSWEAYFLHRNRLITEILHSPRRRPAAVVMHSFLGDVKPLLTLQYSAVRLRAQAIADVMSGPDRLVEWLPRRTDGVRRLWASFPDAQPVDVPDAAVADDRVPPRPVGPVAQAGALVRVFARHLLRRSSAPAASTRLARVRSADLGWWTFATLDAALVKSADGRNATRYRRDLSETRRALARSVRLHLRLWWRWPALARSFRAAAPGLSSQATWAAVFRAPASTGATRASG